MIWIRFFITAAFVLTLAAGLAVGCRTASHHETAAQTDMRPPLEDVLAKHAPSLMAVGGVVGVAQGLTESGEDCLKVLVVEDTPELRRQIPTSLDGYPVVLRPTGELEPK